MYKLKSSINSLHNRPVKFKFGNVVTVKRFLKSADKKIEDCYKVLDVPVDSKQDVIRKAFIELAKKYHPDSGSSEADIDKFVVIENAFRTLTNHNTGINNKKEVEKNVFDIRHTTPQHRQYLSYEGFGHGNPYQREKQWQQARAHKAAMNVLEHRMATAIASDKTLMKKGDQYKNKHDIKTKYGFDRIVEDMIQESMSKGEFENLSGKGKPLKHQNANPYVDFTTHKLNEVLINNGFTPEWITMSKEIDQDIQAIKEQMYEERMYLGPYPLSDKDSIKWKKIYELNKEVVQSLNNKINQYNLIVPLMNKQKFHVEFDKICNSILKDGAHSKTREKIPSLKQTVQHEQVNNTSDTDFFGLLFKAVSEVFCFKKETKKFDS